MKISICMTNEYKENIKAQLHLTIMALLFIAANEEVIQAFQRSVY